MIYDSMKNFAAYRKLAPKAWEKVSAFLAGCTPETPAGRYELDGDRVYAMVQGYETHDADPDKLEIHRKYVDIQLLLSGEESVVCRSVAGLKETVPYNAEKDIAFYRLAIEQSVPLTLVPGNFAVFFPEEGHMPGVSCAGELYCRECPVASEQPYPPTPPRHVVKVVVKIAANAL